MVKYDWKTSVSYRGELYSDFYHTGKDNYKYAGGIDDLVNKLIREGKLEKQLVPSYRYRGSEVWYDNPIEAIYDNDENAELVWEMDEEGEEEL